MEVPVNVLIIYNALRKFKLKAWVWVLQFRLSVMFIPKNLIEMYRVIQKEGHPFKNVFLSN
jgi:hypothetical protein